MVNRKERTSYVILIAHVQLAPDARHRGQPRGLTQLHVFKQPRHVAVKERNAPAGNQLEGT